MIIRDLTLRSAASFGSFHLIRLLFDEYMFFLVEQKIAKELQQSPVAIMGMEQFKNANHGKEILKKKRNNWKWVQSLNYGFFKKLFLFKEWTSDQLTMALFFCNVFRIIYHMR